MKKNNITFENPRTRSLDPNYLIELEKSYHFPIVSYIALANLEQDLKLAENKVKYVRQIFEY